MRRRGLSELDRRIVALALPALGSLVVEPLYNLTDTAIVGHLGRAQLGGLALATTVLNLIGWCAAFIEMATTSHVAYNRGRDDQVAVSGAAAAAYAIAVVLGILLGVVVFATGPWIAHVLGGHGAIQHNATTYLRISAIGLPFLLLDMAGTGHSQGFEDARTPLRILLLSNVVNVVLEVVFVYGAHLGVAGSAWGTVVAQIVAAGCFVAASLRRNSAPFRLPSTVALIGLLRDGFSLVVRTAALTAALVLSTSLAAHIGARTLGAHQITLQVWLLFALTVDALALPAQVYVGTALGRGDVDAAVEVGRRCLRIGTGLGFGIGVAIAAAAEWLPYLFTADLGIRHTATIGLLLCAALQPVAAIAFVLDGLLLGAADFATLRRGMLLALVAFAPFAILTSVHHTLGIVGIWLALTCWLAARSWYLGLRWQSRAWARQHRILTP
ncbi:MAG: MATE family efflux transporter [Actinomycetes bacterium]